MIELKYRKLNRLASFDYSSNRIYYITVKVEHDSHLLGNIIDHKMNLSLEGEIVEKQWCWLKEQYQYVILHDFVVMPNHIHGIIEINSEGIDESVKIKSLSQLIGAFKSTSSKHIHLECNPRFKWQRSFHDHIIRNHVEYGAAVKYVHENPIKWRCKSI